MKLSLDFHVLLTKDIGLRLNFRLSHRWLTFQTANKQGRMERKLINDCINDLPNCSNKLFQIFADDTNMFYTSDNLQHLESVMNEELKLVFKYCNVNKLSINLSKTNYMVTILYNSSSVLSGSIHLRKIELKYLRVTIY